MTAHTLGNTTLDEKGVVIASKTHAFPGEVWDGTEFKDLPCKYTWCYLDNTEDVEERPLFTVYGKVVDEIVNTGFDFNKAFSSLTDANYYFDVLKNKHPKAHIYLAKKSFKFIRNYH